MTLPPAQPPSTADVRAAAVRLAGKVRRTPVLELRGEDFGVAARVVLKLEHMQHTGSFKPRGALHALLTRDIPPAGVVAASGGNHGAAVAWAAARLGVPATIFVPATSPPAKAARIASYGAQVHVVDGFYDEAMVAAQTYAADRDVTSVHAFDEPAVVAGQGTLGLELREQVPDASAVLVTVGGGGLAAGVTVACRDGGPSVVPIEPDSCPTLAAALNAGGPVDVEVGGIAADSTGARRAGHIGLQVFREAGIGVRSVPDEAIVDAQHVLWERCRIATEPGGAVAFAGLLTGAFVPRPGDTVVVVICGANTATLP
ncbi:MAG TPA: serine/threonine dehydratase [Jiangellaceae bacterium]